MKVAGKKAHSGNHYWDGANAAVQLAESIRSITALSDREKNITFNVGVIQGGISPTVVPDEASAVFDMRVCSREQYQWGKRRVEAIAGESVIPGTSMVLEEERFLPPLERTPESEKLAELYIQCARNIGIESRENEQIIGGGSSANLLSGSGLATIDGLGPFGEGEHTDTEWFSISSFKDKSLVLAEVLNQLSGLH